MWNLFSDTKQHLVSVTLKLVHVVAHKLLDTRVQMLNLTAIRKCDVTISNLAISLSILRVCMSTRHCRVSRSDIRPYVLRVELLDIAGLVGVKSDRTYCE